MENVMVWIWLGVMALAVFLEMSTMALVSVWCAVGALICVFAAYSGAGIQAQLLVFVGVSILTAAIVRPLAKKYADPHKVATNADRLLEMEGRVTETVNNAHSTGAVYIDGKTWTARSADGEVIAKGESVQVERMEGVKLIVRAKAAVSAV